MSEGQGQAHAHGREHAHAHGLPAGSDARWLAAAGALIVAFMCGEVVAGIVAHSLALLSDAAHMLTDAASIGLALVTMRIAARPPRGGYTYGLRRMEILSAQANGITLVLLAAWLGYAAVRRLVTPQQVSGGLMLGVALAGVAVNLGATMLLARARRPAGRAGAHRERAHGDRQRHDHQHGDSQHGDGQHGDGQHGDSQHRPRVSLNVEGAYAHVLTDLYAFIATALAAVVVLATGFDRADPIATLIVVALMLHAGAGLIRDSGRIFLEAAPAGLDPAELGTAMAARPCVAEVHDLHVWEITNGMPAASAHVLVAAGQDCHGVRADLERLLAGRGITHATLQVDHVTGPPPDDDHAGRQASGRDGTGDRGATPGTAPPGRNPAGTAPVASVPASTAPASTAPASTAPAATAPAGEGAEPHCDEPHGPRYRPVARGATVSREGEQGRDQGP
jgi:cobalt-zinc-cadmium efflux system protein